MEEKKNTKKCIGKCGEEKEATTENFYKSSDGGLEGKCIVCKKEYRRAYHKLTKVNKRKKDREYEHVGWNGDNEIYN